jgi:hypothetical protein
MSLAHMGSSDCSPFQKMHLIAKRVKRDQSQQSILLVTKLAEQHEISALLADIHALKRGIFCPGEWYCIMNVLRKKPR